MEILKIYFNCVYLVKTLTYSIRPHYGPGFDTADYRNVELRSEEREFSNYISYTSTRLVDI